MIKGEGVREGVRGKEGVRGGEGVREEVSERV